MRLNHLFEIDTDIFRGVAPRPDIINEMIGGDELAEWLHGRLAAEGLRCGTTHVADYGWDFEVTVGRSRHRIVCSCEFDGEDVPADRHRVQVAQTRGETAEPDPVVEAVRHALATAAGVEIASDGPKPR